MNTDINGETVNEYHSPIYVVTMYRWGNRAKHSYVLGAYRVMTEACKAADEETADRAGKYQAEVLFCDWMNGGTKPVEGYALDEMVQVEEWTAKQQNKEMLAMLEELEWSGPLDCGGTWDHICPKCEQVRTTGHSQTCTLGNLLKKIRGAV